MMLTKTYKNCLVFISILLISGCATTNSSTFKREDGAYRGIFFVKYDLPIFSGDMPKEYPYKTLGRVEGKCKQQSIADRMLFHEGVVVQMIKARQACIGNAKALGANGVINIIDHHDREYFYATGDAVRFERVPTKEEIDIYNSSVK